MRSLKIKLEIMIKDKFFENTTNSTLKYQIKKYLLIKLYRYIKAHWIILKNDDDTILMQQFTK